MSESQAALPPAFQKLAISNLMAQSAEQLTLAAVPIVAVLMLQAGPGQIGVIAAVQSLPFLLLSIPLGLLADRMSRKKLMLLSEILRVFALMVLIAALLADQISVTLLAVVGFFAAVGTVGFSVSAPSWCPLWWPVTIWQRPMGAWNWPEAWPLQVGLHWLAP